MRGFVTIRESWNGVIEKIYEIDFTPDSRMVFWNSFGHSYKGFYISIQTQNAN